MNISKQGRKVRETPKCVQTVAIVLERFHSPSSQPELQLKTKAVVDTRVKIFIVGIFMRKQTIPTMKNFKQNLTLTMHHRFRCMNPDLKIQTKLLTLSNNLGETASINLQAKSGRQTVSGITMAADMGIAQHETTGIRDRSQARIV